MGCGDKVLRRNAQLRKLKQPQLSKACGRSQILLKMSELAESRQLQSLCLQRSSRQELQAQQSQTLSKPCCHSQALPEISELAETETSQSLHWPSGLAETPRQSQTLSKASGQSQTVSKISELAETEPPGGQVGTLLQADSGDAARRSKKVRIVEHGKGRRKGSQLKYMGKSGRNIKELKPREMHWWERPDVEYAFSHPRVRLRLERLTGTNIVRITDKVYMKELEERIYEDHLEMQRKRIAKREAEEVERVNKLILQGKMPPTKEIMEHPVFKVTQMTSKIIEAKRSKKSVSSVVSAFYYKVPVREDAKEEITEMNDYMMSPEEYERLKPYESSLVKHLRDLETVDEMYALSDEIIMPLQTLERGQHCRSGKVQK